MYDKTETLAEKPDSQQEEFNGLDILREAAAKEAGGLSYLFNGTNGTPIRETRVGLE